MWILRDLPRRTMHIDPIIFVNWVRVADTQKLPTDNSAGSRIVSSYVIMLDVIRKHTRTIDVYVCFCAATAPRIRARPAQRRWIIR